MSTTLCLPTQITGWLLALCLLAGCSNRGDIKPGAELNLKFDLRMAGQPLELNTHEYTNANGDQFIVEDFRFYLSNVKLRNTRNGQEYAVPESYHLISRKDETNLFELQLSDIPPSIYDEIVFSIGVDPLRNLSLDQVGDLDPSNSMAWDWNTGYKFILLEGRLRQPDGSQRGLIFHVGGNENYRTINMPLQYLGNSDLLVQSNQQLALDIEVDAMALFNSPHVINLQENPVVMMGPIAGRVADNAATNMFALRSIRF
jgi:hypothetical protein